MHGSAVPARRRASGALVALAVAMTTLLTGCGDDAEPAASGGPTTITVGVIPILDVAPLYLGIKQGFFADRDLELKLQLAQGGAAIVPGVVSGQYQFGFSNTTSLLLAVSKGLPLKVVSAGASSTGKEGGDFGAVVVPKDSPIRTAADLAGKRIGVNTLQNINSTTVNKAVRDAGGDPSGISYTELPFPEIPPAVGKGDVDAGQVVEPFLTIAKQQGMREVTSNFAVTDPDLVIGLYFTSQPYLQKNPKVVQDFTAAMKQSLSYADSHPDEARAVLSSYTKIDPSVQEAVTLPKWPSEVTREPVQVLSDLAVQDKLIATAPDLTKLLP